MPRTLTHVAIENFRDRLRKVAAELFVEVGQDGFNMRALAKRVGVSAMTPYRYFSDKDEILASIRTLAFARLADRLDSAGGLRGSPAETVSAVAAAYLQFAEQEPVYYRLMFDFSRPKRHSYPELELQERRVRAALATPMHHLIDRQYIVGDADVMAHLLWCLIHGAVALGLAEKAHALSATEITKEFARIFLAAYGWDSGSPSFPSTTANERTVRAVSPRRPRNGQSDADTLSVPG